MYDESRIKGVYRFWQRHRTDTYIYIVVFMKVFQFPGNLCTSKTDVELKGFTDVGRSAE